MIWGWKFSMIVRLTCEKREGLTKSVCQLDSNCLCLSTFLLDIRASSSKSLLKSTEIKLCMLAYQVIVFIYYHTYFMFQQLVIGTTTGGKTSCDIASRIQLSAQSWRNKLSLKNNIAWTQQVCSLICFFPKFALNMFQYSKNKI